jgi:hypothetical protein
MMTTNPETPAPDSAELVPADQATPALPDTLIDEVVRGIAAAQEKHGLALAVEVGSLIVDTFYGGDIAVLRDRGPKEASLRRLAEHPDLPMSPAALYRTVAIYELAERLGGVSTWKQGALPGAERGAAVGISPVPLRASASGSAC